MGAGLRGLLRCGNRHGSIIPRGRSREERAAEPPPGRPALLPSSSGLPRWAPLGLPRPPRQRRADTQSPSSPRFSPLPLTRALLVSNLVSILQAYGSKVQIRAPPLPAALRLAPRQRRPAAPPGSSPDTNFRSQERPRPRPQRRHQCWPREPTDGEEGRGSFRSAERQDGYSWGRLCCRPGESESSSSCVFLRSADR